MTGSNVSLSTLAAAAGFVWCLSVALLVWPIPPGNSLMRIAVAVIAVAVTAATTRRGRRRCLLSPPYLLGMLVLLFYALAPAVYIQFFFDGPAGSVWTQNYVDSRGELLVLQFAALCFAVAALVLRFVPPMAAPPVPSGLFWSLGTLWAPAGAVLLGVLFVLRRESDSMASFLADGAGAELKHAMAPIMSLCLATIGGVTAAGPPRKLLGGIGVVLSALVAMVAGSGLAFTPVYIGISVILLITLMRGQSAVGLTFVALALFGMVVGAIALNALSRGEPTLYPHGIVAYAKTALASKLAHRQGVSVYCLDRIIHHYGGVEDGSALYFVYAVVPRVLWPNKPILSRGNEFAVTYCGQGPNVNPNHSESITLLGEPILKAGTAGLVVAQLFVAALLGAAAIIGLSGGIVRLIVVTAMLPWLATFQPPFAQYFGTLVKTFLIMLPFVIALGWAARQSDDRNAVRAT